MYIYNAKLDRVVDGDTVDATVEMMKKHNNQFILHSQGVGKYGRCLGNIFFGDENLNDLLITEGHAVAYHGGKR